MISTRSNHFEVDPRLYDAMSSNLNAQHRLFQVAHYCTAAGNASNDEILSSCMLEIADELALVLATMTELQRTLSAVTTNS